MNDSCYPECPNRSATCHADCERYRKQRERCTKAREERQKEIAVVVYQVDQKNRAIKDKRNHKLWRREKPKK